MVSLADISALLDRLPFWKELKTHPDRIKALEARIADLEKNLAKPPTVPGDPCPACGERAMRRTSSRPNPTFGVLGGRDEVWTCQACGEEESRLAD